MIQVIALLREESDVPGKADGALPEALEKRRFHR